MHAPEHDSDRRKEDLDRAFAATRAREARERGIELATAFDAA
ncbi:MAG: hypothetical protein QMC36_00100 [Patescibacteria group bacterium]